MLQGLYVGRNKDEIQNIYKFYITPHCIYISVFRLLVDSTGLRGIAIGTSALGVPRHSPSRHQFEFIPTSKRRETSRV